MRLADLRITGHDGVVIATLIGEVDLSNAAEVEAALSDGTPNDAIGLVIDLSQLDYLDSSGIQLLFHLQAALRKRSQGFALAVPDDSIIKDTFRLAGVTNHIPLTANVEEALEKLAQ